ncbi:MAG: hypothetical protein GWO24_29920, partial [Akkermansiaceae bacterium]|nr:hypothetical protein [Akkermansiaceae bacterium]
DLAPGGMQALSPALHLAALDGLLPYRDQLKRDVVFIAFGGQAMAHDGKRNLLRILGPVTAAQSEDKNPVLRGLGLEQASPDEGEAGNFFQKRNETETRENEEAL